MKKNRMDGKFLDFPLCCLAFINCEKERLREIQIFCVINRALKMEVDEKFDLRVSKMDLHNIKADDFIIDDKLHQKIVLASEDLGITLSSIQESFYCYSQMKEFVLDYELKYKTDSYCRIGRQLFYETMEGKFSFREFLVLCAISSKLGKQNSFYRITYEQIGYRMFGYKTKDIALEEKKDLELFSERQIALSVNLLRMKNLITCITYFREKIYSTRIKDENELWHLYRTQKERRAEKKYKVIDKEESKKLQTSLKRIRMTKKRGNYTFPV